MRKFYNGNTARIATAIGVPFCFAKPAKSTARALQSLGLAVRGAVD